MRDRRLWTSVVLFPLLVLGAACGPSGLPTAGPTPAGTATDASQIASPTALIVPATGTSTPVSAPPTPIFEILIDNVAIGPQGQLYATGFGAYGNDLRHYAQWEGTTWTGLGDGFQTSGNALAVDSSGRPYTEVLQESGQGQATAIMRWEGGWKEITGNFSTAVDTLKARRISSNIPVIALAVDGKDHVYAAGSFYYPSADKANELPMGYVAKWDGETWTSLGRGFDQVYLLALAASPSGKVYVSGEQPRTGGTENGTSGFLAEWDGNSWTQIGTKELSSCWTIKRLAVDKSGGLFASCTWSEPGELVFHWDGRVWTTISNQLEGEAPAIFGMAVDADGRLYIGGSFDSVNGVPARNVAAWDGSSWHALGNGVDKVVNALTVSPGGDPYVVGPFTEVGGLPGQYVARWDGESWRALGH
jgi:hypothetical protein